MFHESLLRYHGDGDATGQPQGVESEAYLNGTSQGSTPEDARKQDHIRGRSRHFMRHPGSAGPLTQVVEYLPFKQRVAGSSPARPTNLPAAKRLC